MNELYRMLLEAVARGQRITRKTDTATGNEALFIDGSLAWGDDIKEGLEENLVAEPVLVLFGAGHVSKALYDLASLHSMRTIILDDRKTELTEERFPKSERHIGPFDMLLQREYDAPSPYFVIFTHGHSYDLDALRYCLSHRFSYLGMIGSKAKSASQIETVRCSEGFPEERIAAIQEKIHPCPICGSYTEDEICEYCSSPRRDRSLLMVVEESQDAITVNQAGIYNGLFHVLGGAINPLDGIGPDKLRIKELIKRIDEGAFKEVIIATNPTEEGDTTAIYIKRLLEDRDITVTRLASGLPIGGDLGYADKTTLMRSLKSRIRL